jgi:hypothetical protein
MEVTELTTEIYNEIKKLSESRKETEPNPEILKRMIALGDAFDIIVELSTKSKSS